MAEVPLDRESSSPKRCLLKVKKKTDVEDESRDSYGSTTTSTSTSRIDLVPKVTAKTADKEDKDLLSTKPKNISEKSWERFQALQKRADIVTKRSTEKRIKDLKQSVLETVQNELTNDEDKDILREHDVKFGPPVKSSERLPVSEEETQQQKVSSSGEIESWQEVKQYLNVNQHLDQSTPSTSAPKSGLEARVNEAIEKGDLHTAEALSDSLAARDFGVKIAEAVTARDFLKRKKEEEHRAKEKRKKKLNWGFEHKQRWETKGNM